MIEAKAVAQAKINLFLRILAQERDGFHSIETLFLRIDLADTVRVRLGGRGRSLDCAGPACPPQGIGPAEHNLAFRAAVAYAAATGWPRDFSIEIDKHIPVGGGLGGGSADAAAVLRTLEAIAPSPAGADSVRRIAASLGSDVPFLASDSVFALAWGRGDRMIDLPPPPPRQVELLIPAFAVSTQWAYERFAATARRQSREPVRYDLATLASWNRLAALASNDLQEVVAAEYAEIRSCVDALRARSARIAMMSGSGSTVFGIFDRTSDAATVVPSTRSVRSSTSTRVVEVERIE